ncbi:TIGR03086 family metal-binding protein [Actinopolymorpha sp. NPDC004070]|uniref:TIGR03086 family metal-binding protein n=1 Tax=Actinopolymorpha sp. NPDC004070 TaxID=3154548 RepID=UPI0033BF874C
MSINQENSTTRSPGGSADLVALDAHAVGVSIDLVARATPADLTRPTPCAEWTLEGLLTHMAVQHNGFAAAARGETDPGVWEVSSLGDDPFGAYRDSAERVLDAFAAEGVLDRMFLLHEFREEPFPGHQAISFHLVDYVVHSWDVAKALGLTPNLAAAAVEAAYEIAQMVPTGEARLVPGAAFGPEVAFSGGSRLDQVVAHLGRSPNWPA